MKATLAPKDATRWRAADRELVAPAGRVFERAVTGDFDADGHADSVAWTLPASPHPATASPGELWVFPGNGAGPRLLAALPGFVPTGPGCALSAELTGTGPHTVTLDVAARCKSALVPRSPTRALVVAAPASADRPVVIELRAADPGDGETLALSVDSTDRDGDGRDDVDVSATVARAGTTPATAHMIWLDRTAGLSREAGEPAGSFERLSAGALVRSRSKSGSRSVAERVGNVRRLMSTVCAESGVARVFDREGATLACGSLQTAIDRLALAELQAATTGGDVREAAAAILRDGWYFAPVSAAMRKTLERAFDRAAPHVATDVKTLSATVEPGGSAPRWQPIRFEADGALLVETRNGIVRAGVDGTEQPVDAEAGVAAWPLDVTGPGGARWKGVEYPCASPVVTLVIDGAEPIATDVLAPRPGSCARGPFDAHLPRVPIAWTDKGLEAFVAGSIVGAHAFTGALATPAPGGVLVTGPGKPALFTGAGLDSKTLSGCAVTKDATAIACVDGAHVIVARRP